HADGSPADRPPDRPLSRGLRALGRRPVRDCRENSGVPAAALQNARPLHSSGSTGPALHSGHGHTVQSANSIRGRHPFRVSEISAPGLCDNGDPARSLHANPPPSIRCLPSRQAREPMEEPSPPVLGPIDNSTSAHTAGTREGRLRPPGSLPVVPMSVPSSTAPAVSIANHFSTLSGALRNAPAPLATAHCGSGSIQFSTTPPPADSQRVRLASLPDKWRRPRRSVVGLRARLPP